MKICNRCGEEKYITEFNKIKQGKDGYRNQCKDLITKMNVLMKKFKFTQVPQLECKDELMNKLFLQ